MATKPKSKANDGSPKDTNFIFKCRLCGKEKPVEDMRTITRFNPVLLVCRDCARSL